MKESAEVTGIWIRNIEGHCELLIEKNGKWYLLCKEPLDNPFSHICEGIMINKANEA